MKPIFNEEKLFLEEKLGVKIPDNCWRKSSKIYLNIDTKPHILEFKAEQRKMTLKKNNIVSINDDETVTIRDKDKDITIKNLTLEEEYLLRSDYINSLIAESKEKTKAYILNHPGHTKRVNISGGKDSDLLWFVMQKVFNELGITNVRDRIGYAIDCKEAEDMMMDSEFIFDVFNTTNDTAQTYLHIKQEVGIGVCDIHSPQKGWYKWLKEDKNWFLPSVMVRNCCSTYKEGQVNKLLNKNSKYISFLGMRKYESAKRSNYDWDLNEAIVSGGGKLNCKAEWRRFLPIVNFRDEDVWLVLIHNNVKFNEMYKYGYGRCGCLLCPYASDYTDMLTEKYYPNLMSRWEYAVEQNYTATEVENRLKWSIDEWKNGKWKQATSKEHDLISKSPTKDRVHQLALVKGISDEMAAKYFKRKCKCCDKKLNSDEIAMNLKLYGRYEGVDDTREFKCKKCICEDNGWTGKEYQQKVWEFRNQGCNLF